MSWLSDYREDVARYKHYDKHSGAQEVLVTQGLWALLQYRLAPAVYRSSLPPRHVRTRCWRCYALAQGWSEVTTGICLPHAAVSVPASTSPISARCILNKRVVIGAAATSIRESASASRDRAGRAGAPVIGDRVWIGPHATVAGPLTVGDHVDDRRQLAGHARRAARGRGPRGAGRRRGHARRNRRPRAVDSGGAAPARASRLSVSAAAVPSPEDPVEQPKQAVDVDVSGQ